MTEPVYYVGIEYETGSYTEITNDVRRMSISRSLASPTTPLQPGEATLVLDNMDGRYSPENRMSYFPLSNDTLVRDLTSNGNHGTASGTNFIRGIVGGKFAASYDSTVDNIRCGSSQLFGFNGTSAYTFEFWFYLRSFRNTNFPNFLSRRANPAGGLTGWVINCVSASGNYTRIDNSRWNNGAFQFATTGNSITINRWYHYAATYDGSTIRQFIDGNSAGVSVTTAFAIGSVAMHLSIGNISLNGNAAIDGALDEVRIWDVARTRDQILADMNRPIDPNTSGLVGYWPMDGENKLRPQMGIKIEASYGGNSYQLFKGYIDQWSPNPDLSMPRNTTIQCRDAVKKLYDQNVTTSLFVNYGVNSAFVSVLSQSNIGQFTVDSGILDTQPFIWFRDINATTAINDLLAEGFFFSYVGGDGIFNVKKRYFDLEQPVVASLTNFKSLSYLLNDDDVYNDIYVEGTPREVDSNTRSLAFIPQPMLVPASASVSFFLEYLDPDNAEPCPAIGLVAPVSSTDYSAFVNSDGTGTNLTTAVSAAVTFFGQTAYNVVFNGGGTDAWLTRYGIRGRPIHRRSRITSIESNASSQNVYGKKTYRLSSEILGDRAHNDAYAEFLLDRYANPAPDISASITNDFPAVLDIELADKIVMVDSVTGVQSNYIVQRLTHDIEVELGLMHSVSFDVYGFRDSEVLILDDPSFGILNSRKLGF